MESNNGTLSDQDCLQNGLRILARMVVRTHMNRMKGLHDSKQEHSYMRQDNTVEDIESPEQL